MKKKVDPLKQQSDYIAFLEKRLASENFKKNVSKEEYEKTKKKLEKEKLKKKFNIV